MNDLDIVAVRIEHPCRIIARIVFGPSLRCFLALASGVHSRFVECIYLRMVFRYKSNMHRLGIGLSFFEPEKSSFAVTKTLQIGVSVLAFVICKVCDPKWLQGPGVIDTEGARAMETYEQVANAIKAQTPLGRTGMPEDIGVIAAFLASDEARWLTGEIIFGSGGLR